VRPPLPPARLRIHHAAGTAADGGDLSPTIAGANGTVIVNASTRLDGRPLLLGSVHLVPVDVDTGADDASSTGLALPSAAWVRLVPGDAAVNLTCATRPSWRCVAHNITVPTTAVGGEYAVDATVLFTATTMRFAADTNMSPTAIAPALIVRATPPSFAAAAAELVRYSFEALRRDRFGRSMCVTVSLRDAVGAALPLWMPAPTACVELIVNGSASAACRTLPRPHDAGRSVFEVCGFPVPTYTEPEHAAPLSISAVVHNVNAGAGSVASSVLHLAPAHDACRNAVAAHGTVLGPFASATPWARFIDVPAPVLSHATPSHGSVRACLLGRNTSVTARRLDNCTVRCLVPASTAVYGSGRRAGVAFVTSSAGAVARTSSVLDVAAPTPLVDGLSVRLAQADGPAGAALVVGSSAPFSAPAASYQGGSA